MSIQRQAAADLLLTAAIVSVGFVTGQPVLTAIVGGIGVNWASDLTQAAWKRACGQWLGPDGMGNHDLQNALSRAFEQAFDRLERAWQQTPRGSQMRRQAAEAAAVTSLFALLRADAASFCQPDGVNRAASQPQVQSLLYGDAGSVGQAYRTYLRDYLYGHDAQLVAFIEQRLVDELAFCFGEELKTDRPESNRAWRAFQRLLLENLQTGVGDVQAEQQEIKQALDWLTAWAERMEGLAPDVRERTGLDALTTAVSELRQHLDARLDRVDAELEAMPERIRPLLREELAAARVPADPPVPPAAPDLVGRDRFLDKLAADLTAQTSVARPLALTALRGLPGVGKTALALALANRPDIAAAFPDGRAWLPLGPQPDLFSLLGRLLEQFGARSQDLTTSDGRADRLRSTLAGRRCLLLLDDIWQAEHVRPFLQAVQPPTRALFTTRFAHIAADLHADNHDVRVLKPKYAVQMLADAGDRAAAAVAAAPEGAKDLAAALGHLPLALHVAGRRLNALARVVRTREAVPTLRVEIAERLLGLKAAAPRPGLADLEPSLEAVVDLSYDGLPNEGARRAFRRLAVFGGQPLDFDLAAAATVWEMDADAARNAMIVLMDAGLVETGGGQREARVEDEEGEEEDREPALSGSTELAEVLSKGARTKGGEEGEGRFSLHQVIAVFAQARLHADADEAQSATLAHAQHYAKVVYTANNQITGQQLLAGLAWLDAEIDQIRRAIAWAQRQAGKQTSAILRDLVPPLRNYAIGARSLHREYASWLEAALAACRALADKGGEANVLQAQGDVLAFLKQTQAALAKYEEALGLFRAVGDRLGEANVLKAQGDVLAFLDERQAALATYEEALGLFRAVGDRLGEANVLQAQGDVLAFLDERQAALATYEEALSLFRAVGDRLGEANVLKAQGDVLYFLKQTQAALATYEEALGLYRAVGDRLGEANVLKAQGDVLYFLKQTQAALATYEEALGLFRAVGDRLGEANVLKAQGDVLAFLDQTDGRAGEV